MDNYDVAIALRVYPRISKNPIGNFRNKLELFQASLKSLLASLGDLRARFYIILDGCDDSYSAWLQSVIPAQHLLIEKVEQAGNAKTFMMQMQWLLQQQDAEYVFLAEDDYLFIPGMFCRMTEFLKRRSETVHFVSPHNHFDYYRHEVHQKIGTRLVFENGEHWHLPVSTCLTFLTTKRTLSQTQRLFASYARGNFDFSIFAALVKPSVFRLPPPGLWRNGFFVKCWLKALRHTVGQVYFGRKYVLAVPINPVATHMQEDELGPGVNWQQVLDTFRNES